MFTPNKNKKTDGSKEWGHSNILNTGTQPHVTEA